MITNATPDYSNTCIEIQEGFSTEVISSQFTKCCKVILPISLNAENSDDDDDLLPTRFTLMPFKLYL